MNQHATRLIARTLELERELERLRASPPPPVLPALDDELRWILGRPNFACHGLAECLRRQGQAIAHKAEHEQAAAIHWMLGLYLKHGATWREEAERILKAWRAGQ